MLISCSTFSACCKPTAACESRHEWALIGERCVLASSYDGLLQWYMVHALCQKQTVRSTTSTSEPSEAAMDVHVMQNDICIWHHACVLTDFVRSHSPCHSAAHHALPHDLAGCVLMNVPPKPSMGLHRSFILVARWQGPESAGADTDLTASCSSATWALSSERLGPRPERREHMLPGLPGGVK